MHNNLQSLHLNNHTKTHDETLSGTELSMNNTVNDKFDGIVKGKTEFLCNWYQKDGLSTQIASAQGKNKFRTDEEFIRNPGGDWLVYQTIILQEGSYVTSYNGSACACIIKSSDGLSTLVSNSSGLFTVSYGKYRVYIQSVTGFAPNIKPSDITAQLELGTTPTNYESFVPALSAPNSPSYIIGSPSASTYKVQDYLGNWYEFTLPEDLHDVGDVKDYVAWDKYSRSGYIRKKCGKKVFDGTETGWSYVINNNTQYASIIISRLFFDLNTFEDTYGLPFMCTHFKFGNNGTVSYVLRKGNLIYGYPDKSSSFIITLDRNLTGVTDINSWRAFLSNEYAAGTPVTVYYQLKNPIDINISNLIHPISVESGGSITLHQQNGTLIPLSSTTTFYTSKVAQNCTPIVDNTIAYSKVVPTGNQKYVTIDKIGGRSILWNQLVQNGNFESTSGWINIASVSNNIGLTNIITAYSAFLRDQSYISGHIYVMLADIQCSESCVIKFGTQRNGALGSVSSFTLAANTWTPCYRRFTATTDDRYLGFFNYQSQSVAYNVKNFMLFDATKILGVGNESTTASEFKSWALSNGINLDEYQPYDTGSVLSAKVDKVISKKSNDDIIQEVLISSEIQSLNGYGESNPSDSTEYNYIDFTNKKFVKLGQIVDGVWITEVTPIITDISNLLNSIETGILTFVLNNSSTVPECPMEFLTDTASVDYPAQLCSVDGNEVMSKNNNNTKSSSIILPILRSTNDVADTYDINTGNKTQNVSDIINITGYFAWSKLGNYNNTNSKLFLFPRIKDWLYGQANAFKYDGSELIISGTNNLADHVELGDSAYIYVNASNDDTGMGGELATTNNEIKAYFYGWKMCHSDGTSPYYKSEVPYSLDTWVEWTSSYGTINKDITGLTIGDGTNSSAVNILTNLKPSTKYGFLFNIVSLSGSQLIIAGGGENLPFGTITSNVNTGNNKYVGTTLSSFSNNQIIMGTVSSSDIIKIKDIRIYELPTGSQIESDFTNLTANELAMKYLFYGLYIKYWKHITDGQGLTNVLPTESYDGYTPYKLIYQLKTPIETQLDLGELPTHERGTIVEQSGLVKADIDLTSKILGNPSDTSNIFSLNRNTPNSYIDSSGNIVEDSTITVNTTDYIPVKPNTNYAYTNMGDLSKEIIDKSGYAYLSDRTPASLISPTTGVPVIFKTGINDQFVRLMWTPWSNGMSLTKVLPNPITISGLSSQIQFTGKNLLSTNVFNVSNGLYGVNFPALKDLYNSMPEGSTFTISYNWLSDGTDISPSGKVYISFTDDTNSGSLKNTFTKDSRVASALIIYASSSVNGATYQNFYDIMLELGTTATTYEPYCGGVSAPNPSYSQDIVPYVSAGTYKVPCTSPRGGWWEFTIPDMHGIGIQRDTLSLDLALGGGTLNKKNNIKVFYGSENWTMDGTYTNTVRFSNSTHLTGGLNGSAGYLNRLSNRFPVLSSGSENEIEHQRGTSNANLGAFIAYWINKNRLTTQDVAGFKAWLTLLNSTGTPEKVLYSLETPVESSISTTWKSTSSATELSI